MAHPIAPHTSDDWSTETKFNSGSAVVNVNTSIQNIEKSTATTHQIKRHQSDDWGNTGKPILAGKKLVGQSIAQKTEDNLSLDLPTAKKLVVNSNTCDTTITTNNNNSQEDTDFEDFLVKRSHTILHKKSQSSALPTNDNMNSRLIQRKETVSDNWNPNTDTRQELQRKDTVSLELITAQLPPQIDVNTALKMSEQKHLDDIKKREEEKRKQWLDAEKKRKEVEERLRKEKEERKRKRERVKVVPPNDSRAMLCTKQILCCYQKFEDLHIVMDHVSNEIQFFNLTDNHIDNKFNKVTERGVRFTGVPKAKLCSGTILRNGNEECIFASQQGVKCHFKFVSKNECDGFVQKLNESMQYAEEMGHNIVTY